MNVLLRDYVYYQIELEVYQTFVNEFTAEFRIFCASDEVATAHGDLVKSEDAPTLWHSLFSTPTPAEESKPVDAPVLRIEEKMSIHAKQASPQFVERFLQEHVNPDMLLVRNKN